MSDMNDVPQVLRFAMTFIDRVGFPIMAFLIMAYLAMVSMTKLTQAMERVTQTLDQVSMKATSDHKSIKRAVQSLDVPRRPILED